MRTELKQDVRMRTASIQLRILTKGGILSILQQTVRFHTKQETLITFIRRLFHVVQFGSIIGSFLSQHLEYSQTPF